MPPAEFVRAVNETVRKSERQSAFVFVHGFRVPFDDAMKATGRLARDLKFDGASILFSWPAGDAVRSYFHDRDNADWSVKHLEALLQTLANDVKPQRLHLIAHSMGARVLAKSIDLFAGNANDRASKPFENIVLAAPDFDPRGFEQTHSQLLRAGSRITLYICECDFALERSKELHEGPRIGSIKRAYGGIDVMDANTADLPVVGLNHSYLLTSQTILNDLFVLINFGTPPNQRASTVQDGCCWRFVKR